jgi:hypothetical protein
MQLGREQMNEAAIQILLLEKVFARSVLSSDSKNSDYSYVSASLALEKKFVRFGSSHFIPTLSIDIDKKASLLSIIDTCEGNNLPSPSLIVNTDKGVHIHWVLEYPIRTANTSSLNLYKLILAELIQLFGGDVHASAMRAGRVWRNPLKHDTVATGTVANLSDFKHLIKPSTQAKVSSTFAFKMPRGGLKKVKEGQRNVALFDHLRKFAYRNYNKFEDMPSELLKEALEANKQLEAPLPLPEVESIVKSVSRFIETRYVPRTENEDTISYNRKLAQKKVDETERKFFAVIYSNPMMTLKHLKSMSVRKLAKLVGISKSTAQRYKSKLRIIIKKALLVVKKFSFKVEIPPVEFLRNSEVTIRFPKELKCNFTYGVP